MTDNNPFGDFLTNLAAELGSRVIEAWAQRAGGRIQGTPREQAMRRCLDAGLVAFLHRAQAEAPGYADLMATTDTFFQRADVVREITRLLRGQRLDLDELRYLFEQAGYPHQGLFDFSAAMADFEGIFLLRAVEEEALQDTVKAAQLLQQTRLLESQLGLLQEMLAVLRQISLRDIVGIQADTIIAHNVVSGAQVSYSLLPEGLGPLLPRHWERHYLETLIARCDRLDLTPLSAGEATADSLTISDVFTTLYLDGVTRAEDETAAEAIQPSHPRKERGEKMPRSEERQPITAVEAIAAMPRLVILGQPGSGKSTLVNHVAAELARRRLAQNGATFPQWTGDQAPLPLRIILRRFADWLVAGQKQGDAGDVWEYLEHLLARWGCADSFDGLRHTLIGVGGIVFFDGLDEIRDARARRAAVKGAVTAFAVSLPKCQVVVTSRPYAYSEKVEWRLSPETFPVVSLALFAPEQIKAFNRAWYLRVMGPRRDWDEAQCHLLADQLTQTILRLDHLHRLARSPLLLTLIAQVNSKGGTLPENRADLYQQTVNLLLARWENRIVLDALPGDDVREDEVLWLGVATGQLRDVLAQLAYRGHQRQSRAQPQNDRTAEISRADLKLALVERFDSGEKAEQIITYIQHRAGLLVAQEEEVYTFPHRTFQEYLTARYLLNQPKWATLLRNHVREAPDWWREVFLLSAGIAITTLPNSIPQLINELLPFDPGRPEMLLAPDVATWIMLAAQALVETNFRYHVTQEEEPGSFTAVYRRVQAWLKAVLVADELLAAAARAEAGTWLVQLGDDRTGVGVDRATGMPDIAWGEEVPAGEYTIGDDNSEYEDEKSRGVTIEQPYHLSRYPITNAQFQCFVEAPDFANERWWVGIAADERGISEAKPPFANHPRETVSWYQAIAFCRWLSDKLGEEIDLPHEHEWEVAARYPDNRLYPWGDVFDSQKANTYEGERIGQTTAVGMYPAGRNPTLKLHDLSGNVWEWCRNKYDDPKDMAVDGSGDTRVVRGGSWGNYRNLARAAYRNYFHPPDRNNFIGFRLVVRRPPSQ